MSKPYSPGVPNTKLDHITALSWNHQVAHVFAVAGTAGVTTIWDLRSRRDMTVLSYNDQKGDRGSVMSDVAWQPDNSTRLVTACDDSSSPVLTIWDLRNSSTPETILTGHEKGVLSVSWSKDYPDRLLSSGKDNRAIFWDPKAGNGTGVEVLCAQEWVHQIGWSAHRPDIYATASSDGRVGVYDMTTTDKDIDEPAPPYTSDDNASLDIFV
jgi:protein transport protein SEC31